MTPSHIVHIAFGGCSMNFRCAWAAPVLQPWCSVRKQFRIMLAEPTDPTASLAGQARESDATPNTVAPDDVAPVARVTGDLHH